MVWDPRRVTRAVLALIITSGTMALLILTALGKAQGGGEALAVIAGFQGIVLAYFYKADADEGTKPEAP
jgi:hypothetical protein